jgi:hypothetical protein
LPRVILRQYRSIARFAWGPAERRRLEMVADDGFGFL